LPPIDRPFPRFVAEPPHELEPYGRWEETLVERFLDKWRATDRFDEIGDPVELQWFPERTYAGRVYVPAAGAAGAGEVFGFVSFRREEGSGQPSAFDAVADFTDETAEGNPDWRLDLNEEVIGRWRGPGDMSGDLTLVWGTPLVRGGAAVTADLGGEVVDQCALVQSERFTLVALDAVTGLGDELYIEVKLWSRAAQLIASETLYEEAE
jgi:hypothetical protein